MTRDEIRTTVRQVLHEIAPEVDLAAVAEDRPLRQEIDLDSMDFLNFAIALHERLGVEIPEADYAKLGTLASCVDYLAAALDRGGG